jgi:hypothetical protein
MAIAAAAMGMTSTSGSLSVTDLSVPTQPPRPERSSGSGVTARPWPSSTCSIGKPTRSAARPEEARSSASAGTATSSSRWTGSRRVTRPGRRRPLTGHVRPGGHDHSPARSFSNFPEPARVPAPRRRQQRSDYRTSRSNYRTLPSSIAATPSIWFLRTMPSTTKRNHAPFSQRSTRRCGPGAHSSWRTSAPPASSTPMPAGSAGRSAPSSGRTDGTRSPDPRFIAGGTAASFGPASETTTHGNKMDGGRYASGTRSARDRRPIGALPSESFRSKRGQLRGKVEAAGIEPAEGAGRSVSSDTSIRGLAERVSDTRSRSAC